MMLEGLSQLKNKTNDLIGNRTRDLPTVIIVPQTTTKAFLKVKSVFIVTYSPNGGP
jgi:hypothetical protein